MQMHFIAGPTAVGKTAMAIEWAQENNAEIVSADSLQLYRGMDIGTAKPTADELAAVPHHLIDCADCKEQMSVADFCDLSIAAVNDIYRRGKNVLVTGGSGFYLKAFYAPVADAVEVPEAVANEVDSLYELEGLNAVLIKLKKLNPEGLGGLDEKNPRRVVPALKRCMATGKTLAQLREAMLAKGSPFDAYPKTFWRLDREDADLHARIDQRTDAMLALGLVAEVERLLTAGIEQNPSAAGSIGYRETIAYLRGDIPTQDELANQIKLHTRQLVKKQRTWLRWQLPESTETINLS